MTSEEQEIVEEMLNGMTIDQMIGEMFNIEFASNTSWSGGYRVSVDNSTGLPFAALGYNTSTRKVTEFINDYKFGNFTISNVSGQNISYIENAAKNLREIGLNNTGVEPYITLNYMSSNNMQGLSSMPANIQLASAGKTQIITAVNEAYAKQLKYYGINSVTNQYLVNNEDFTSLSTTFGTDIAFAATTAKIISQSYQNHGVAMIPDMSQYGYWGDIREESEIYSKDYRLLESAVNSGTSMIILPAIYYEYLESASMMSIYSELFMKDYLRDELGYKGVLMLDSDATSNIYDEQNFNEDILRAINNGVDMIGYKITFDTRDSSSTRKRAEAPLNLYNYLLTAVENGTLSQGRVKEAVTRILLSKIRNNIFEEKEEVNVEETISVINQHSSKFITAVGNFWSFDESEKILLISEDYSKTGTASSIGDCFGSYFSKIGYSDYKVKHTSKLHPEDELPEASSYNKIFICVSSLNTGTSIGIGGKANFIEFVGDLYEINTNICLIYTSQADMRSYFPNIENYILLNGVYEQTFDTLFSILSGQAQPNNNLLY